MAQDTGWFIHSINASNDRTVGKSTANATVDTNGTGAGNSLQVGEKFTGRLDDLHL